jgi:hypothetical protein
MFKKGGGFGREILGKGFLTWGKLPGATDISSN